MEWKNLQKVESDRGLEIRIYINKLVKPIHGKRRIRANIYVEIHCLNETHNTRC